LKIIIIHLETYQKVRCYFS